MPLSPLGVFTAGSHGETRQSVGDFGSSTNSIGTQILAMTGARATTTQAVGKNFVANNMGLLGNITYIRIDSGTLFIPRGYSFTLSQASTTGATSLFIHINGGTLEVEGSSDPANPHTFLYASGTGPGETPYRTRNQAITITAGHFQGGSAATPEIAMVTQKGLAFDPGPGGAGDKPNGGVAPTVIGVGSWDIHNLTLYNPVSDAESAGTFSDSQLPWLGYRQDDVTNFGPSAFRRVTLENFGILDVSGAGSARSGAFPLAVGLRRGALIGDNGPGARLNNLIGVAFLGVSTNTSGADLVTNTRDNDVTTLANSNWYVVGNSDGLLSAVARINRRRGGFIGNRDITFRGADASQRIWIPETNERLSSADDAGGISYGTLDNVVNFTTHNFLALDSQTDSPYITDTVTATQYPLQGPDGRFSVINQPFQDMTYKLRTQIGWISGAALLANQALLSKNVHQDNEYLYAGQTQLKLAAVQLPLFTDQATTPEVTVPTVADTLVPSATFTNAAADDATVTITRTVGSEAVTINYTATTGTIEVDPSDLMLLVKNQMITNLDSAPNTALAATANPWVFDHLNGLVNGSETWTVTSAGARIEIATFDDSFTVADFAGTLNVDDANVFIVAPPVISTISLPQQAGNYIIRNGNSNATLVTGTAVGTTTAGSATSVTISDASYTSPSDIVIYWAGSGFGEIAQTFTGMDVTLLANADPNLSTGAITVAGTSFTTSIANGVTTVSAITSAGAFPAADTNRYWNQVKGDANYVRSLVAYRETNPTDIAPLIRLVSAEDVAINANYIKMVSGSNPVRIERFTNITFLDGSTENDFTTSTTLQGLQAGIAAEGSYTSTKFAADVVSNNLATDGSVSAIVDEELRSGTFTNIGRS